MSINHRPPHPGEVLGDLIRDKGWTTALLARHSGVDAVVISGIWLRGNTVTPSVSKSLATVFSVGEDFFMSLQRQYDEAHGVFRFDLSVSPVEWLELLQPIRITVETVPDLTLSCEATESYGRDDLESMFIDVADTYRFLEEEEKLGVELRRLLDVYRAHFLVDFDRFDEIHS